MSYVEFLEDSTFRAIVKRVLDSGRKKDQQSLKDFHKNVIDPFAAIFDSAVSGVDHETWKQGELLRQRQKTLTNQIGNLHQAILGNVDGWQDLGTSGVVDLVCHERKIIAEVKNKFNTLNSKGRTKIYEELAKLITPKASEYKDYTAYLVQVIPKTAQRQVGPFTPSDGSTGISYSSNDQILEIDGASFYTLATGRHDALSEVFAALPTVIGDIFREDYGDSGFAIKDWAEFSGYFTRAFISDT